MHNILWSDKARLTLVAVMAVLLAPTLIFGTAAIIGSGQPSGDTTRAIASVFAWLFTAVFLATFALALVELLEERRRGHYTVRHASH